jgi:hypothetical protein
VDGRDGVDGKDGKDGTNGLNGKDGADGQKGQDGTSGSAGTSGASGASGTAGRDGATGKDGAGITDIRIDDDGNFLFTLTDGSVINAGKANASGDGTVAASATPSVESPSALQLKLDSLQKQVNQQGSSNRIAYIALAVSIVSLLWNVISLVNDLKKRKKPAAPVA